MNAPPSTDHILVLAAGRGSRMGGPKFNMVIEGRAWWEHQAKRLRVICCPVTWVVPQTIHDQIAQQGPLAPLRTVPADPETPMFDSLMAGVRSLAAGRRDDRRHYNTGPPQPEPPRAVFVIPVDVPAPGLAVWTALAAQPDRPAIPSHNGKHGHPVYLPWPWIEANLLSPAAAKRPPPERRLDRLIANGGGARIVETDDPSVTINLNTPADIQAWLAADRSNP